MFGLDHYTQNLVNECNRRVAVENSAFLKTAKNWRIENVQENRDVVYRTS